MEIGKAVEAELGKRQGQRTDLVNEGQESLLGELSVNLPEVPKGKTTELAAEKAGFGSDKTYRDAKTVTEKAAPELVSAVFCWGQGFWDSLPPTIFPDLPPSPSGLGTAL